MPILILSGTLFLGYLLGIEKKAPKYIESKIKTLKQNLRKAVSNEEYELAAELRDKIKSYEI